MREISGILLIIVAYICTAIFVIRIIWRMVLLLRISDSRDREVLLPSRAKPLTAIKMVTDIFFLTRLFRVNPLLWFGEWVFHVAFVLIAVRHMRYVLHDVPDWAINIQSVGLLAGYVFLMTLIYIFIIKLWVEKKNYFSSHNFFLLLLLFLLSISGFVMKHLMRPDIVDMKMFITSALAFKAGPAPKSMVFIIHFVVAFVFLAYLPTHIFAAPLALMEARKHEDGLAKIMHEE